MKTKTSELSGAALDWAVRILVEKVDIGCPDNVPLAVEFLLMHNAGDPFLMPSTDWAQGGPIIEREEIELAVIPTMRLPENWADCKAEDGWCANIWPQDEDLIKIAGPTPLIAAMRAFVAAKLGDEVDVPEELTE